MLLRSCFQWAFWSQRSIVTSTNNTCYPVSEAMSSLVRLHPHPNISKYSQFFLYLVIGGEPSLILNMLQTITQLLCEKTQFHVVTASNIHRNICISFVGDRRMTTAGLVYSVNDSRTLGTKIRDVSRNVGKKMPVLITMMQQLLCYRWIRWTQCMR